MNRLLISGALVLLFPAVALRASEDKEPEGKLPAAIVAHDPEQGFRLAPAAVKRLGISLQEINGTGPWSVPAAALVRVKRSVGVYRVSDEFITLVIVEATPTANGFTVKSEDLRGGDSIVIKGGAFLRVIDLDLSGGGGDSCGG